MTEPGRASLRRFSGALLMAVGGLMAALCGVCTVLFTIDQFTHAGVMSGGSMMDVILVLGGVPTLIGVLLAWWGFRLYRSPAPAPAGTRDD